MSQKKKVWLALCLVIPAGIAFAEEEVIIIEEPVAAEEVVEEVVEVEPVEVEPVAEEEIEVVDGYADNTVTWAQIRTIAGPGKEYEIVAAPSCDTQGWYKKQDGTEGYIAALGHDVDQITLEYDSARTGREWTISYDVDCDNSTSHYYVFSYCAGTYNDPITLTDGTQTYVKSCNHLLDKDGKAVGTAGIKDVTWPIDDDAGTATVLKTLGLDEYSKITTASVTAYLIRSYTGEHDWQKVNVPANCTTGAGYYYKCARCDAYMTNAVAKTYPKATHADFVDNALFTSTLNLDMWYGASGDTDQIRFVQTSGTKDPSNHFWDVNFRNPILDKWYSNEELDSGDNDWDGTNNYRWTSPVNGEPTCQHGGELHGNACSACKNLIVRVLDKVDHQMTGAATVVSAPTCTTNGLKAYACKWCGFTTVDGADAVEIPALGHTFNRQGYIDGTTADGTATPDGKAHPIKWIPMGKSKVDYLGTSTTKDLYIYRAVCEECDYYVDLLTTNNAFTGNATQTALTQIKTEATSAGLTGVICTATSGTTPGTHPANFIKTIPAVAATATKNGYTEGKYCSLCGAMITNPRYVAPLSAGLAKNENGQWEYQVGGKKDTTFVGLVELDNELFFIRDGGVDTSVMGIQQPEEGGTWYFFDHGQVQRNHPGFALYDGAWFYIDATGKLDEGATGYYAYDGAQFLVTGGWVRTDYTGMYPESDARTSFRYISAGMWMEDFTGTVTLEGETWNVTKGVATK